MLLYHFYNVFFFNVSGVDRLAINNDTTDVIMHFDK